MEQLNAFGPGQAMTFVVGLFAMAVPATVLWGIHRLMSKRFQAYWKLGLGLLLSPLVLAGLIFAGLRVINHNGVCSGWMDAPDRPCTLLEGLMQDYFWLGMALAVPYTVLAAMFLFMLWWKRPAKKARAAVAS